MKRLLSRSTYRATEWQKECLPPREWDSLSVDSQIARCLGCPAREPCLEYGKTVRGDETVFGGEYLVNGKPSDYKRRTYPEDVFLASLVGLIQKVRDFNADDS